MSSAPSPTPSGPIGVLASAGEAKAIADIFGANGIPWLMLEPWQLQEAVREGRLAAAIIGAEMLEGPDLSAIAALLEERPSWANFSFLLTVDRERATALQELPPGNLMLLERPLVPAFLLSCAGAALRLHARQLRTQEQLRLGEEAGERLRGAAETLEKRVSQRMRELALANERLHRDAAELRRLQAELIHVSRLSAMGTMASTLAHELNQPLTAVSSYISGSRRLLSDPSVSHEDAQEALLAAETAALRGGQILRRLREFVSRGNVSVKPEQLGSLVAEVCELGFVDAHLLGVSHQVKLDRACLWVSADRIQVQQVLINLIRNALQAMENAPRKHILISSAPAEGDMIEISVADTGEGISPEVREALFSPFQSTRLEGMGIGLSISRTIVEAHGGKIWAEDGPRGAVFRFTLPCAQAPAAEDRDPLP